MLMVFLVVAVLLTGCSAEKQAPGTSAEENISASDTSAQIYSSGKTVVSGGDTVKVEYQGTLPDGTIFDSSTKGEPLSFIVGAGAVIPGFERGVIGMKLNEEKTIIIKTEEAYGPRDEKYVRAIPKTKFPPDLNPEVGKSVNLQTRDGQELPATVIKVEGDMVTLDFNHPLAGKDLTFAIKVVGIN